MAAASLILGILGLVLVWVPFVGILGLVFGIVGIFLAAAGKKAQPQNAIATAGLVLSIIAVVFGIPLTACYLCIGACTGDGLLTPFSGRGFWTW